MIIDMILGRKDSLSYNSLDFYRECLAYGEVGENIVRAMAGGVEAEVKEAIKDYIRDNEYNALICDYIDRVNWVRGTEPEVEREAAEEFNVACREREEAARKMIAPAGKDGVYFLECGVLLSPEHDEFDFYANFNPDLPFGFYDENLEVFLRGELGNKLYEMRDYVKKGVHDTYAIISFQGFVDVGSDRHYHLLSGEFDSSDIEYSYFKNTDEIVWSARNVNGKLIEGFLEKEIKKLAEKEQGGAPMEKARSLGEMIETAKSVGHEQPDDCKSVKQNEYLR